MTPGGRLTFLLNTSYSISSILMNECGSSENFTRLCSKLQGSYYIIYIAQLAGNTSLLT